jgi:CRP-like cAMP-binding protein
MTADELASTHHPFLQDLSDNHLSTLASLAMPVHYDRGETIFREGDMADRFYLIHEGAVSLRAAENKGAVAEIQQLRAGDVLGWSWLFEPYVWQYDAVTTVPTSATFFYGTWLRDKCEEDSGLGYEVMVRIARVVVDRLQATRERFKNTILVPLTFGCASPCGCRRGDHEESKPTSGHEVWHKLI